MSDGGDQYLGGSPGGGCKNEQKSTLSLASNNSLMSISKPCLNY